MTAAPEPLAPLDRLVTLPQGIPELTLGWEAIRWASSWLKHPNGLRAGERWQFVESQVRFFLWWYAVTGEGRWVFDHAARRLVKGAGKSPAAGVHCWIEFCAPVRLKDFDPSVPGGCVGRRVDMPLIEIAATAESQTANTMRMVRALATKKSRMVAEYHIDVGKTVMYDDKGGELRVITSSASAEEGSLTTFAVLDETEHWNKANGGEDLSEVMDRNLAKTSSRAVETANAWALGGGSVAESTFDAWVAQEEGRTPSESRILYDARVAPPDTDLADERSLEKALAFVYDDCYWADQRTIKGKVLSLRTKPDVARRFYLNQPSATPDAWVTPQECSAIADPTVIICDGDEIVMFFDGSKSSDATALIGCHAETGHVFCIDVWERPAELEPQETWNVPVDEVDDAVAHSFDRWDIKAFFADVREWESFAKVSWPKEYRDRLALHAVPGGKDPQPIAWDMRTRSYDFTMAAEMALAEITERAFTYDGDSRVTRHLINSRRHPNRWGVSICKESPKSEKKIDAAVCVIGARMVRRLYLAQVAASEPEKKRTGRVRGYN